MKVCAEAGCPTLTTSRRCNTHTRSVDRARGSRQQRGYDTAHTRERARWAPLVRQGSVACWRCGQLIPSSGAWDLGHDDRNRSITRGPEHARCNRAAGGKAAHR